MVWYSRRTGISPVLNKLRLQKEERPITNSSFDCVLTASKRTSHDGASRRRLGYS